MSRWVNIDSILHSLENIRASGLGKRRSLDVLKELIINNSKEIVHCKECKWRDMWECPMSDKDRPEDDYYCGDGEYRKKYSAYHKDEPTEITYQNCSDALLKMWMDDVLTDAEYNRIMDKLNKADRKTESNSEKPNNCEHITEDGVTCAKYPACDDCLDNPLNKVKGSERLLKGR